MGITIHYKLAQEKGNIKRTLDRAEAVAREIKAQQADIMKIGFDLERPSETQMIVKMAGCEWLDFNFKPLAHWKSESTKRWNYQYASLEDMESHDTTGEHYIKYPEQMLLWCASFCKTQYAENAVEHKWVCDLIKSVAIFCRIADVSDEGDYYHTGNIEDAKESIESLGKMIGNLGGMLKKAGFDEDKIIKGGETTIKSDKKKKNEK